MGLITSSFSSGKPKAVPKEDPKLKKIRLMEQKVIKLLLYGPGECGKTTILRRMMLIKGNDLSTERKKFRPFICFNVVEGAYTVLKTSAVKYGVDFLSEGASGYTTNQKGEKVLFNISAEDVKHAQTIYNAYNFFSNHSSNPQICHLNSRDINAEDPKTPDGPEFVKSILYFVDTHEFFRQVLSRRSQYALYENWTYFAQKLHDYPKWGGKDWTPTDDDLLMSRLRTTGLNKFTFKLDNTQYELIDIGGQRVERVKFFTLFSQVDCVLFVSSLADYNEMLFEDQTENKLTESINVWIKAVKNEVFKDTWMILFLNKVDLFRSKFYDQKIPIKPRFVVDRKPPKPSEEEDRDCALALKWFEDLYVSKVDDARKRKMRTYVTSALTDCNIEEVMRLCVDFLLQKLIEESFRMG